MGYMDNIPKRSSFQDNELSYFSRFSILERHAFAKNSIVCMMLMLSTGQTGTERKMGSQGSGLGISDSDFGLRDSGVRVSGIGI